MIVVGGTYSEVCFEPIWEQIFGSGFRAVNLFLENYPSQSIDFYTCSDKEVKAHLDYYKKIYPHLTIQNTEVFKSPAFHYDHPLKTPTIFPRPDLYREVDISLNAKGEHILAYGLLEAQIILEGEKIVYDPQSPVNPIPFSKTGSKASQLITIINKSEASIIVGSGEISQIRDYFFEIEHCHALILKMGAQGAMVFEGLEKEPTVIPVYRTQNVWPIGSGDVFSAYFAFNWFKGTEITKSAKLASKATAHYCNTKSLSIGEHLESLPFPELISERTPKGKIYLAGPFFTFNQRWLVNEVWNALKSYGLNVFSPFHDVGHGKAKDVVDKDLKGLDESEIVFAIIDGLDSGTLFEVGYAVSQKKKVIAYVQNENEESLKMLEGSGCIIEDDLTTAIYKTFWELASK
jgi:nucleoside 2-deoxyribosyltransferase